MSVSALMNPGLMNSACCLLGSILLLSVSGCSSATNSEAPPVSVDPSVTMAETTAELLPADDGSSVRRPAGPEDSSGR